MKLTTTRWWDDGERGELHARVFSAANSIRQQQVLLRDRMVEDMEMYSDGNITGMGAILDRQRYMSWSESGGMEVPRFRIATCLVDTVWSLVAHTPPVPIYLTTGEDYAIMRKAHRRTQVLQGQMNVLARGKSQHCFLDACKVGTGVIWGETTDAGAELSVVHPLELLVEHSDGLYRTPRMVIRVRHAVSRADLADEHPRLKFEIEHAAESGDLRWTALFAGAQRAEGTCELLEAIVLGAGDKPGRRVRCVSTAVLEDEPFYDTELPMAVCRYRQRDFGFYGSGLVESARDAQYRVDDMCRRNARAQELGSTLKLINPNGPGTLLKGEVTNEPGEVWEVNGSLPVQVVAFSGTLPDLQEQIDLELERLLFMEGVSQSQAGGEGGGRGLTSGVAVRADDDVKARRLLSPADNYQAFCLDTAKLIERLNDRMAEQDSDYEVSGQQRVGRKTFLITSKWSELALPEGHADVQIFPMSALPSAPSGKFAMVAELIEGGYVDKKYAMQLMQFPDLESYSDDEFADDDVVRWQIEQMLDGIPQVPPARLDMQTAYKIARRALLRLTMQAGSDREQDMLDAYITYVEAELQKAAPPPALPAPAPALAGAVAAPPLAMPNASIAGLAPQVQV